MKASNNAKRIGNFSDDPRKPGEKSDGIQKKHREKEESFEKAGEHRKNEEFLQHRKNGENFGEVWCFLKIPGKGKSFEKSW